MKMTILYIYKLDSEDAVSQLNEGEYIIGRGPLLQCDDRRVSRNHGIIKITQNLATISSTHVNPCFYQSAAGTNIQILPRGSPISLGDGDKFALLADKFWYKIKFEVVEELPNANVVIADSDDTPNSSRNIGNEIPGVSVNIETRQPGKKSENFNLTGEDEENLGLILTDLKNSAEDNCNEETHTTFTTQNDLRSDSESETNSKPARKKVKFTRNTNSLPENHLEANPGQETLLSANEDKHIETENRQEDPAVVPSTSIIVEDEGHKDTGVPGCSSITAAGSSKAIEKKQWRDRCWYAADCYRKSKSHLKKYRHPGDSDFDSDPNDDRPLCSFGGACYRRNPNHRMAYKHPQQTQKPPDKQTRQRKPKKKKQPLNETPEDDYDLDDPFIDDSGSEYEAFSSSEDSDSDWSEN